MPEYTVNHAYATQTLGPWQQGQTVELTAAQADAICRDSEGCLTPAWNPEPEQQPDADPDADPDAPDVQPDEKPEPEMQPKGRGRKAR